MPRFFMDDEPSPNFNVTGENAAHISRSLRMSAGESFTVTAQTGFDFLCEITDINNGTVSARVLEKIKNETEPSLTVTLYQCMPKSDKMESIIQKSVELGVSGIVPVLSSRVISRPDEKALKSKISRWQKIALEAAKQSERGIIPVIGSLISFSQLISKISSHKQSFLFYEKGGIPLSKAFDNEKSDAAVIIGPEGGFSQEEAQSAANAGAKIVTLGKRILRTETAPLAAVSSLMLMSGNLE